MSDAPEEPRRYHLVTGCLRCDQGTMVLRKSRFDGDLFYGCNRYPNCKATIAYSEVMETLTTLVEELTRKLLVHERRAQMRVVPPPKGAA